MRLLICTQAIDLDNPVLGFFHRWVEELARYAEEVHVICLYEGRHSLPPNVHVVSLGKERGEASKLAYALRFLRAVVRLRDTYDAAFVHMNQEYVLLAGLYWRLRRTPIYLWRNHHAGSFLTRLAVALSTKVFCTSKHSYTARFGKTVLMPVGVDTALFSPGNAPNSRAILSLGRISPSKNIHVLLEALAHLKRDGIAYTASIVGNAQPGDLPYFARLKEFARREHLETVHFLPGVVHDETPEIYRRHHLFVNTSKSGMLDKTIFEAAASGCAVIAASDDFAALAGDASAFRDGDALDLAGKIAAQLDQEVSPQLQRIAHEHSLQMLGKRLSAEMSL